MNGRWVDVGLVVVGALLLSAKGIFAKLLYAEGVSMEAILVLRAALSWPLIVGWALWRLGAAQLLSPDRGALVWSLAAGLFTYYLGAMLDFRALQIISASLERVLLFSYPVIVVLARAVWLRRMPSRRVVIAVLTTYAGILLAVGGFDIGLWQANLWGALLVVGAAVAFAAYLMINEHAVRTINSQAFIVYATGAATAALVAHFAAFGSAAELTMGPWAWTLLLAMTLVTNVVPLFFISESIKRIGAQRASILSTVGPPATIFMGVTILGETMQWFQVTGAVLIVAGIVILETHRAAPADDPGKI